MRVHVTGGAGHDHRYAIDATKIMTELDYKPEVTVETVIRKAVRWYFDNENWWRSVMDRSYKEWLDKNYTK